MNTGIKEIRVSKKQKEVIEHLRGDFILITGNECNGAWVGNKKEEYHINSRIFWNLVDKGLIYQQLAPPFDYVLSTLGKTAILK